MGNPYMAAGIMGGIGEGLQNAANMGFQYVMQKERLDAADKRARMRQIAQIAAFDFDDDPITEDNGLQAERLFGDAGQVSLNAMARQPVGASMVPSRSPSLVGSPAPSQPVQIRGGGRRF